MPTFEEVLSVAPEDIELELDAIGLVPWAEFILNPRRLRGSDFLMRWSQGVWSERRVIEAVNATGRYFALPYGPSGVAPQDDPIEFERYFERLDAAGLGKTKRPDLLIFQACARRTIDQLVNVMGGLSELPFLAEESGHMQELLGRAVMGVECETSLWRARAMPDYGTELRPMKRLGGRPGPRKDAVLPTLILKEEDRVPISRWAQMHRIGVHIWHVFFDLAFGLSYEDAERLICEGYVCPTRQTFQAPGGAVTRKVIYKIPYQHAYQLGDAVEEPCVKAQWIEDANGHVLPYVTFDGGRLRLKDEALRKIDAEALKRLR